MLRNENFEPAIEQESSETHRKANKRLHLLRTDISLGFFFLTSPFVKLQQSLVLLQIPDYVVTNSTDALELHGKEDCF